MCTDIRLRPPCYVRFHDGPTKSQCQHCTVNRGLNLLLPPDRGTFPHSRSSEAAASASGMRNTTFQLRKKWGRLTRHWDADISPPLHRLFVRLIFIPLTLGRAEQHGRQRDRQIDGGPDCSSCMKDYPPILGLWQELIRAWEERLQEAERARHTHTRTHTRITHTLTHTPICAYNPQQERYQSII